MSRPRPVNGVQFSFPPGQAIGFDPSAFDQAITSQGVQLVHFRAMRCPVGLIDRYDTRRPHEDHSGCSNGHVYTWAGAITCLFTGASDENKHQDIGYLDGSTVQITAPRFYDDTMDSIEVVPFDRFYLAEDAITIEHYQLVEASITGRDKLSFPIIEIVDLMDSSGKRYESDSYQIENGQIVWLNGGPGYDSAKGKGIVYVVRYTMRPFWYVSRVQHQIRICQIDGPLERSVMRMPQNFVLTREIIFESEQRDDQAVNPDSPRQAVGPRDGAFGPR